MARKRPQYAAAFLTLAIVFIALISAMMLRRTNDSKPTDASRAETPESTVAKMLDAAKKGNVDAYLDCFAGDLLSTFESRMSGQSSERVSSELKNSEQDLQAHAISRGKDIGEIEVMLDVEKIYRDFNKRQEMRLRKVGDRWKIVEIQAAESFSPPIPYGTPVMELPAGESEQPAEAAEVDAESGA